MIDVEGGLDGFPHEVEDVVDRRVSDLLHTVVGHVGDVDALLTSVPQPSKRVLPVGKEARKGIHCQSR